MRRDDWLRQIIQDSYATQHNLDDEQHDGDCHGDHIAPTPRPDQHGECQGYQQTTDDGGRQPVGIFNQRVFIEAGYEASVAGRPVWAALAGIGDAHQAANKHQEVGKSNGHPAQTA